MKAFVTGSTGLVGSNLVHLLTAQGHSVKALARSEEKAARLLGSTSAEIVVGDMTDVAGFAPTLAGCDVIFHTAAYFREYFGLGDHWAQLEAINVRGTIEVLTAAEQQGVQRAVYVSTAGVLGRGPNGAPADETIPPDELAETNRYFKSKVKAEEALLTWLKTHTLPVVQILPSAIMGPRDAGPTAVGQIILDFLNGKLPALVQSYLTFVDARDVGQTMINAVERGRSGERYIVSGEAVALPDVVAQLAAWSGRATPRLMPYPFMINYARFEELLARLTRRDPLVTANALQTIRERRLYDISKAQRELGMTKRPFAETLHDTVMWYVDNGYLQAGQVANLAPAST
ncbi:MAG: NAD-dependent epimerase/dehydratase family protein [Chloroflexi bacterium]|nr:NAD-dependent epimerase/dehydratase family protein [Chloroflexota bacterium]